MAKKAIFNMAEQLMEIATALSFSSHNTVVLATQIHDNF